MVNKPLIRPYFWGGTLGGGRLTSSHGFICEGWKVCLNLGDQFRPRLNTSWCFFGFCHVSSTLRHGLLENLDIWKIWHKGVYHILGDSPPSHYHFGILIFFRFEGPKTWNISHWTCFLDRGVTRTMLSTDWYQHILLSCFDWFISMKFAKLESIHF